MLMDVTLFGWIVNLSQLINIKSYVHKIKYCKQVLKRVSGSRKNGRISLSWFISLTKTMNVEGDI